MDGGFVAFKQEAKKEKFEIEIVAHQIRAVFSVNLIYFHRVCIKLQSNCALQMTAEQPTLNGY